MDYMDPMCSVLKKADKLNISLSLYFSFVLLSSQVDLIAITL